MKRVVMALALLAVPAAAQENPTTVAAAVPPAASAQATPEAGQAARPQRRRITTTTPRMAPEGLRPIGHVQPMATRRTDLAPMPNREVEAPRVALREDTSISPSLIHRSMPSRGAAADGAASRTEDRLFTPAPGFRLTSPFQYDR